MRGLLQTDSTLGHLEETSEHSKYQGRDILLHFGVHMLLAGTHDLLQAQPQAIVRLQELVRIDGLSHQLPLEGRQPRDFTEDVQT